MILEQLKVLDVQRIGNTDEGITAGIDESSLPFVFELVSKSLYSNPIGSIIREITSNCFDSHIEAGVSDPVVINRTYNADEGYSIEFIDVGIGLSPDRVHGIYMNYFSSTKRSSNTQIGAFGIGSKVGLAYADFFYITTIFNGIKYEYLFHKGENKPTLETLSSEETTEHNGTTIKINVNKNDIYKFEAELKLQLTYFDNVWVKGWSINNNYDIYEGKHFKFRSDIGQNYTNIHICIGKVRYPIDFSLVDVEQKYMKIPIAVKFEIGELKITPSREAIRYDEATIALVKERIKLARDEVLEIFKSQNPEMETLVEYESRVKDSTPKIIFDDKKQHQIYIWADSGLSKDYRFKPLSGLNIKKTPKELFFMWEAVGYIDRSGKYIEDKGGYRGKVSNRDIIEGKYLIVSRGEKQSSYTNIYISQIKYDNITLIRRKEISYEVLSTELGLGNVRKGGKAKTMIQYMKIIDGLVKQEGKTYAEMRPTDEWVNDYKKSIKESTLAWQRKMNNRIFVRDISRSGTGIEVTGRELLNRTGILVYGFKEDRALLDQIYYTVITHSESISKFRYKHKLGKVKTNDAFMVLQIAQNVEKSIIGAKKTIYCRDFLNTRFVKRIETLAHLKSLIDTLVIENKGFREKFIRGFKEEYNNLSKPIYSRILSGASVYSMPMKGVYIKELLEPLEEFKKKFLYKLPPLIKYLYDLNHIVEDTVAKQQIISYLKPYKIRLRNDLYLKDKRQLEYEAGLKKILAFMKNPINNLLTYTLKQTENGKDENS